MSTPTVAEAFPAGEFLADELESRGWSQADFAEILGRPTQFVSEIVTGKKEITRESAAQIAAALGTSAEFWLNLQDAYLLWKHSQDEHASKDLAAVRIRARLRALVPMSLLIKRGLITSADPTGQAREVQDLLCMANLDDDPAIPFAARRSNDNENVTIVQRAWVACVRRAARTMTTGRYSPAALESLAQQLAGLSRDPAAVESLPARFAATGVKLVYIEAFPGGKLDGCAMKMDGNPVIGISGRGQRLDKVLFTVLHEVAHVLLGHVDDVDRIITDDLSEDCTGRELDADRLAAELAIPGGLRDVPHRPNATWVADEAGRLGVHPIVVIGRLQKEGVLEWRSTLARNAPNVANQLAGWSELPAA